MNIGIYIAYIIITFIIIRQQILGISNDQGIKFTVILILLVKNQRCFGFKVAFK